MKKPRISDNLYMDSRLKKIKVTLPKNWIDASSDNPNGPPTFIDNELEQPGVLQISTADYKAGKIPNPNYDDLIRLSETIGLRNEFGEIKNRNYGNCSYGKYGYVEFTREDFPYISVWHLSNGKDFIFSTFICSRMPEIKEVNEVANILTTIKRKRFLF